MPSTIVQPVADRLKQIAEGLAVTPTVKAYRWAPARLSQVPAIVIEPPDIGRPDPEEGESQLGAEDWDMSFPVVVYVDLREGEKAQARAVELVEALITAIDDDPTLAGLASDVELVEAESFVIEDAQRPLFAYRCTVALTRLVAG